MIDPAWGFPSASLVCGRGRGARCFVRVSPGSGTCRLRRFSLEGRLTSKQWRLWLVLPLTVISILLVFVDMAPGNYNPEAGIGLFSGTFGLLFVIPAIIVYIKHFHDRDKSGWWVLIGLIPIIGAIWLLIELGFLIQLRARSAVSKGGRFFSATTPTGIASVDFLIVPTLAFERLFVFVILGLGRRRLLWIGVTTNPTAGGWLRQITEAFPWDTVPGFLSATMMVPMARRSLCGFEQGSFAIAPIVPRARRLLRGCCTCKKARAPRSTASFSFSPHSRHRQVQPLPMAINSAPQNSL